MTLFRSACLQLSRLVWPPISRGGAPSGPRSARAAGGGLLVCMRWLLLLACGSAGWAAAQAMPEPDVTASILALERSGRAQPRQAAAELAHLLPATADHGAERLELLTVQGLQLAESSQAAAAEAVALELETWAREPTTRAARAAALLIRARSAERSDNNLEQAALMLQTAREQLPDTLKARDRYRYVFLEGNIKEQAGKVEEAVRLNHEALALADGADELWRRSEARTALAYSYYSAKQLERAREFVDEAIALATQAEDWVSLGRAHNTAGIVLDGMGDRQGERRSFDQAIIYAMRAGSKSDEVRYRANLADFFLQSGEYKTALGHAERALPLARELRDANSETVALANMGLALISMQHLEQGKRYVHEAIAIDERRGAAAGVSDTYRELGSYLEKAGDLSGAAAAFHKHRELAAGLFRSDQQKAILTMQEQYDAGRRASALELLKREQAIKAEQLRRKDLQQRLWWLLAALCVVSFSVMALFYRRVRQNNGLLSLSNEKLKLQGERDPLTGLSNRRHFQTLVRQLSTDGAFSGTVFLVDIDHFKRINDRFGHSVGDAVLVEIAGRLRATLREQDMIVRWGGEEFLVMVQAMAPEQIEGLAQRMLGVMHDQPVETPVHRIDVSGSIGFATFPLDTSAPGRVTWERALNLVDTAMYLAKAHGRNRAYGVKLASAGHSSSLEAITRSLEAAWQEGQVTLTLLQGGRGAERQVAA